MLIRFSAVGLCLLFIIAGAVVHGQEVLQNNPPSIKWRQLKTPGFRVIYPEGGEAAAQRVANTLEHVREPISNGMGEKLPRRIPIIIQNNNSISNGFMTVSPRRSEFYTMPPQNYNFIGTNRWLDLLAIHEYRHIAQFNRSRTGIIKWLYYLFGQNTQAAMAFTAAPRWFWEGDATLIETAATPSGRGRIPAWNRVFRSNLLEGKRFNYNKQHLGSFKDEVPDHYRLGLYMTAHVRKRKQDHNIWNDIAKDAFGKSVIPFTFSNAIKKNSGEYLVKSYEAMMDDMAAVWQKQLQNFEPTSFDLVNKQRPEEFTDYSFPQILEDGTIVAFKSGLSDPGQLVQLDENGNELKKYLSGVMNNTGMLSSTQYKVYWNEYEFDPRWRAKTYSVIKSYDFATGKMSRITKKSRYAGAGISPDGYKIATILNTEEGENHILVLDAISGIEINRFGVDKKAQYGMPTWATTSDEIVVLKTTDEGKSVISVNANSGAEEVLIASSHENIGNPLISGDYLFYSSPYNGIDNIYVLERSTGVRYQVTKSKYGAYSPAISKDQKYMVYADHSVDGLNVVKAPLNKAEWVELASTVDRNSGYLDEIIEEEGISHLSESIPENDYDSKKYSRLANMFNVHSWGPFASTDLNTAQAGIFSRDVLSTTRTSLGYTYDINEESGFASANFSYQGWYPVVNFQFDSGNRKSDSYEWEENTINTGLSIPLLLTRDRFFRTLTVSNSIGIREVNNFKRRNSEEGRVFFSEAELEDGNDVVVDTITVFQVDVTELDDGEMVFNNFSIEFTNLLKVAPRNIASKWGQFLTFEHYRTISGDFEGRLAGVRGGLFFPSPMDLVMPNSIFRNHSLNFRFGTQSRKAVGRPNEYSFRNVVFKPRGFSYPTEETFSSIITNYELPLVYPDLSIGPLLYIKRIKMNLFYDYGQDNVNNYLFTAEPFNNFRENDLVRTVPVSTTYISYGAELTVDFNVMRFPLDIEMGVRFINKEANRYNTGGAAIEFIFAGINF